MKVLKDVVPNQVFVIGIWRLLNYIVLVTSICLKLNGTCLKLHGMYMCQDSPNLFYWNNIVL